MSNNTEQVARERLFTKDYIALCLAGFMISFSFFLLVPTLPLYLKSTFNIGQTMIGIVLSCYVVAVLSIRPLAGFAADALPRKRVYITSYVLFVAAFIAYFFVTESLSMFILLRILHGFTFGMLTTAANTFVIDIMPSSRRGEGLGYYGVTNNLAMAFGPMVGLFIIESGDFRTLFATSLTMGIIGLVLALSVRAKGKSVIPSQKIAISTDRFFLKEGIHACISFFLIAIPYGMTTSYIALYAIESGITVASGLFFTIMSAGLVTSRLNSGKRVDKGYITQTIRTGMLIALIGAVGEASLSSVASWSLLAGNILYFSTAFLFGFGFGTIFPAYNTLFINLAPASRRATANATYLTGWDVGIGSGMLLGGWISEYGYAYCYLFGIVLIILSLLYFTGRVTPHFNSHRLR